MKDASAAAAPSAKAPDVARLSETLRRLAREAGAAIMAHYADAKPDDARAKEDGSPLTKADLAADAVIVAGLEAAFPDIPIVTEERAETHKTAAGDRFFLVDPLDGTKEFIKKNGQFTVNIALIEHGVPTVGVVYAPALGVLYATNDEGCAEREEDGHAPELIRVRLADNEALAVVASASHRDAATDALLGQYEIHTAKSIGSSLKLCLVAAGEADFYPRLGPTMEWDTAAGHAVLRAAGGRVDALRAGDAETAAPTHLGALAYAKAGFRNTPFLAYAPSVALKGLKAPAEPAAPTDPSDPGRRPADPNARAHLPISERRLTHLEQLEAESIHIIREVAAEAENPVMLYSIGKDSSVMLHLALKAFYPAKPPFPLLHVDTTWKFREMITFRDARAAELGLDLIVHINQEGVKAGVGPFSHGSALHTDIMKTQALKQALDKHRFDVAFGGARRDEEKSRAKERIFSFRSREHRWDPKNQRPELWSLYNMKKHQGESIRAFPLSNWTELDIWLYIHREKIALPPLYFAAKRPVMAHDGALIMVDDARAPIPDGVTPEERMVRFRTLGCYPLTGAVESDAATVIDVIRETLVAKTSERQGRVIDKDAGASMEKKKQDGYF